MCATVSPLALFSAGIELARTWGPICRRFRPTWAMSNRRTPTGTCRQCRAPGPRERARRGAKEISHDSTGAQFAGFLHHSPRHRARVIPTRSTLIDTPSGCSSPMRKERRARNRRSRVRDLDAALVSGFLDHLERDRGCGVGTRNTRLAAVHSFFRFASYRHPEHAETIGQVLAIPQRRPMAVLDPSSARWRWRHYSPPPIAAH